MGAQRLAKMVISEVTSPPTNPIPSQGTTALGSWVSSSTRQGQMPAATIMASKMAVRSTVPWTLTALVAVDVAPAV